MNQKDFISREDLSSPSREHLRTRLDFHDLSPREQASLLAIYGKSRIAAIEPLSETEEPQFTQEGSAFNFHFQTLYKVRGNLEPTRLAEAVQDIVKSEEYLRTNYCSLGGGVQKIILSRREDHPGIICQDLAHLKNEALENTLRQVMEADMRQEFDLMRGTLFRLSCFRTGEDEFVVLATVSHAIAGLFDARDVFRRINQIAPEHPPAPSRHIHRKADEHALRPSISILPYEYASKKPYRQSIHRAILPPNIAHTLENRCAGDNLLLMSALSHAWELLLTETEKLHDTWIPLLISGENAAEDGFRILSFHPRSTSDISIEKTIAAQAVQIKEGMQHHGLPLDTLSTGHFLSFYDFLKEERSYASAPALPEGNILTRNLWAAQGARLAVYFCRRSSDIHMTFLYDENRFKPYGIALMAKHFAQILQQMIIDWKQPLCALHQRNILSAPKTALHSSRPGNDGRDSLYDRLSKTKLMDGVDVHTLKKNIGTIRTVTCSMGDRIPKEDTARNFILLLEGTVARNIETSSGMYNFLDIQKAGAWINETSFLPGEHARLSIEILSEEADLLYIPMDEMNRLVNEEPAIQHRMLIHTLAEMEKYQRLWVQV